METYTQEAVSFDSESQYGFKYREIKATLTQQQQREQINTLTHNAIFFQLEGELRISWGGHDEVAVRPGELYFLPRGATVSASIVGESVKYIAARLDHNLDTAKVFSELFKVEEEGSYDSSYSFSPLPIVESLSLFLDSIKQYIVEGLNTPLLQEMKFAELYFIFRKCYTKEECMNLFHPIIDNYSKFKTFILDNLTPQSSIDEVARKANMSRSTFDRKFKEAFGMTPLKWVEMQTRMLIYRKAAEPNVAVKDLMYEVGVYNSSQFTKLCKRLCGVTPSDLLRSQ